MGPVINPGNAGTSLNLKRNPRYFTLSHLTPPLNYCRRLHRFVRVLSIMPMNRLRNEKAVLKISLNL